MITNKQKIAKLETLLSRAIVSLSPECSLMTETDDVWKAIDKIIEIDRYIKELQEKDSEKLIPPITH
ncbi:hypothetical protein EB001_19705 [bacterium]|nr:hypothetical protein [bacterium]